MENNGKSTLLNPLTTNKNYIFWLHLSKIYMHFFLSENFFSPLYPSRCCSWSGTPAGGRSAHTTKYSVIEQSILADSIMVDQWKGTYFGRTISNFEDKYFGIAMNKTYFWKTKKYV